jgi:antiviral helicase SKI2
LTKPSHCPQIISVKDDSIVDITTKAVRIDPDKIVNDVKRREIPRFSNDPPGPSTTSAVEDLKRFHNELGSQQQPRPEVFCWIRDFRIQDLELVEQLRRIGEIRTKVDSLASISEGLDQHFRSELERLHRYEQLKEELVNAEFLTSEASLTHLPEYHMRVEVGKVA